VALPSIEVDFVSADVPGDELHEVLRRAREAGPVVRARFAGLPAFLVTRYEALRAFFGDQERFPGEVVYEFATRPNIGHTFIDMAEPEHTTYRQLAMPAFRSRAVSRFIDAELTPLADELLDRLTDLHENGGHEADLATGFAHVLPFWSISRKLGLPRGSEERQRAWALAMLDYPADPDGALRASAEVTEFLRPTLAERRDEPADDVISGLLAGEYHGVRLTDDEIASHVRLLYAVGATTTSDALSTLLWRVVTEPGLLDRARAEPEIVPRIVHESLRTEPAVCVLPRIAPDGGEVGGVELPPSSLVLCGIAAANRDPEVYADPDRFDPDRAEGEILTFGFGAKYCPGSHLARQQLAAALDAVVHRLPGLRPVEVAEPHQAVLRRVETLRVTWDGLGLARLGRRRST
jgi:cytochrome P450